MSPGGKLPLPPRLAAVVLPVGLLGFGVAVAAAVSFAVSPRDLATLAGIAGLLAASTLAERYPVPLDGIDTGGVSLGFVFCTAAIVLYGWEAGVVDRVSQLVGDRAFGPDAVRWDVPVWLNGWAPRTVPFGHDVLMEADVYGID